MKLVRKLVSVFSAIIVFISVTFLTLILNINVLTSSYVIEDVTKSLDYLELVGIKGNFNQLKDYYNELYSSLQKNNVSQEMISKIYKTDFFNKVTSKIILNRINMVLSDPNDKLYIRDPYPMYNKEELDDLLDAEILKAKIVIDDKTLNLIRENNNIIMEIEKLFSNNYSIFDNDKIAVIRYVLGYPFKIILICLIIILIIIMYLINKEKCLPYIFIPIILASFLTLVLSLFFNKIIIYVILDDFLLEFINPFVKVFTNNLLFSSLILLFISIIYLMINEFISNGRKRKIKPKLKLKKANILSLF